MRALRNIAVLTVAATAAVAAAAPAGAVHQSHHGPFVGETAQHKRILIRTPSHTRLGIRFGYLASCGAETRSGLAFLRNVPVAADGRFSARTRRFRVRGKIGFDPQGNPAFPEPFSFENNEARGTLRVVIRRPGQSRCLSGPVMWEARR